MLYFSSVIIFILKQKEKYLCKETAEVHERRHADLHLPPGNLSGKWENILSASRGTAR